MTVVLSLCDVLTKEEINYISSGLDKNREIIVCMSGGVDSSVTAALLSHLGFKVIGVTFQLHEAGKACCSSVKDVIEAKAVADSIKIRHRAIDYIDRFNRTVMHNFFDEYSNGTTPSPCVRCNQYIKFDHILSFATTQLNAQAIATGHYIMHQITNNDVQFLTANDPNKDQTYFMSMVSKTKTSMMRFPIGCMLKSRVRELAKIMNLKTAAKKDSQGLCFIQNGTYRSILSSLASKSKQGIIVDTNGNVLGTHNGIHNYTVGQRKGINASNGPWFVLEINANNNEIIVGRDEDRFRHEFYVHELNILDDRIYGDIQVKVRSRNPSVKCNLLKYCENSWIVQLDEPTHSIAPGQVCAFYCENMLIGGARIMKHN